MLLFKGHASWETLNHSDAEMTAAWLERPSRRAFPSSSRYPVGWVYELKRTTLQTKRAPKVHTAICAWRRHHKAHVHYHALTEQTLALAHFS